MNFLFSVSFLVYNNNILFPTNNITYVLLLSHVNHNVFLNE